MDHYRPSKRPRLDGQERLVFCLTHYFSFLISIHFHCTERHAYIVTVEYQLTSISDIDLKNTLTCNSSVLRALKCCLHYTKAIFHPLIS